MRRRRRSVGTDFTFSAKALQIPVVVQRKVRSKSLSARKDEAPNTNPDPNALHAPNGHSRKRSKSLNEQRRQARAKSKKYNKKGIQPWKYDSNIYVHSKATNRISFKTRKSNTKRSPKRSPEARKKREPKHPTITKLPDNFVYYYLARSGPAWPQQAHNTCVDAPKPETPKPGPVTTPAPERPMTQAPESTGSVPNRRKRSGRVNVIKSPKIARTGPAVVQANDARCRIDSLNLYDVPDAAKTTGGKVTITEQVKPPARRMRSRRLPSRPKKGKVPLTRSIGSQLPHTPPVSTRKREKMEKRATAKAEGTSPSRRIKKRGDTILPYWLVTGQAPPKPGDSIPPLRTEKKEESQEKPNEELPARVRRRSRGFRVSKTPWRKPEVQKVDVSNLKLAPSFNQILQGELARCQYDVTIPDEIAIEYVEDINLLFETYHQENAVELLRGTPEGQRALKIAILLREKLAQKEQKKEHLRSHEFHLKSIIDAFLFQHLYYQSAAGKDKVEEAQEASEKDAKTEKTEKTEKDEVTESPKSQVKDAPAMVKPTNNSAEDHKPDVVYNSDDSEDSNDSDDSDSDNEQIEGKEQNSTLESAQEVSMPDPTSESEPAPETEPAAEPTPELKPEPASDSESEQDQGRKPVEYEQEISDVIDSGSSNMESADSETEQMGEDTEEILEAEFELASEPQEETAAVAQEEVEQATAPQSATLREPDLTAEGQASEE